MTTLTHRPNTALLVIDLQNGVLDGAFARAAVVSNVVALVDKAREAGVRWCGSSMRMKGSSEAAPSGN